MNMDMNMDMDMDMNMNMNMNIDMDTKVSRSEGVKWYTVYSGSYSKSSYDLLPDLDLPIFYFNVPSNSLALLMYSPTSFGLTSCGTPCAVVCDCVLYCPLCHFLSHLFRRSDLSFRN